MPITKRTAMFPTHMRSGLLVRSTPRQLAHRWGGGVKTETLRLRPFSTLEGGTAKDPKKYRGLLDAYLELVRSNRLEKDPTQHHLILNLQMFQNNINEYYPYVERYVRRTMPDLDDSSDSIDSHYCAGGSDPSRKPNPISALCKSLFSSRRGRRRNQTSLPPMEEQGEMTASEEYESDKMFILRKEDSSDSARLGYSGIRREEDCSRPSSVNPAEIQYIRGIYVYGSVGRGKTYFLNMLFDNLQISKLKMHFHNFMQEVHRLMHEEKMRNAEDPIRNVSIKLNRKYKVLFIDEFQVVHISDAMIIKSLFNYLFHFGTVLLCSSNRNPLHLYHNGLNRDRFVPFLHLLYRFNYVYEIKQNCDFRMKSKTVATDIFNVGGRTFAEIADLCALLYADNNNMDVESVRSMAKRDAPLSVSRLKQVIIPFQINGYAVFSFLDLCSANVNVHEYDVLASSYHTIFLYGLDRMNEESFGNEMRRFILLMDIMYERNVKIIFFSSTPLFQLFETNGIIAYVQSFLARIKRQYSSFNEFVDSYQSKLQEGCFDRSIFIRILESLDVSQEIGEKIFDAINHNVNKEYIPMEHLRGVLCFHIENFEKDRGRHLQYLAKRDGSLEIEPSPYLLFDENIIDTSQENVFASMRTISRIKHMCTVAYLAQHSKLYGLDHSKRVD